MINKKENNREIMKVVRSYFDCLIAFDGDSAIEYCCKSCQGEGGMGWLRNYLRMFNDVVGVEVIEVKYHNDHFAAVRVLLDNVVEEREYAINVLRELEPYVLSNDGTWGVNPISLRML